MPAPRLAILCPLLTWTFAVLTGALAVAVALAAVCLRYFPRFAAVLTSVMLIVFPLLADTSDWNWFDWAKRYTLLVSAFIWAFASAFPESVWARRIVRVFPFVLMLNLLEAAALDLVGPGPLNGALLLCVALCGPLTLNWDYQHRRYGFRDVYWQAAYALTLARLYVLNPDFENGFVASMVALLVPGILCLVEGDTHNWITWRIFSIYPLLLQDALLPKVSDLFYPESLHASNRVEWQSLPVFRIWLAIGVAISALMIFNRLRASPGTPTSASGGHEFDMFISRSRHSTSASCSDSQTENNAEKPEIAKISLKRGFRPQMRR